MKKKTINGTFIQKLTVTDPDYNTPVEIEIYKLDSGGIIGIDSSYIESEEPIYSPFDKGFEVNI